MAKNSDGYVFGLDIGTRSIVGTVGYRVGTERFVVVAQTSVEHKTRAVIDGQIHDIHTVAEMIAAVKSQLELEIGEELYDVSIAAAGRVLKTKNVYVEYEMPSETNVTQEHVHALDSIAVEKAYDEIRQETDHRDKHFYCVGYSPVKYYLNGYPMEMIEKHMASSIGVEMIATFLPDEVVNGLYAAVEEANLHVASITLEPIAAINVAIPERFRLLNIALVDVGAGTSDISIVKDGSIIAFGMMPLAGDEITEKIAKTYLVDFETAEKAKRAISKRKTVTFKNIMGETLKLTREEIQNTAKEAISSIVEKVADKITELNGGNAVSAVFIVGGGGKMPGFTELMAKNLGIADNRVAIRGAEVLQNIDFSAVNVKKDSTLVTPIGICLEYYEQRSNFIHVRVNEERVKVYDNGKATILDACIHAGFSQSSLFPTRGNGFEYTLNGEKQEVKGHLGEAADILCNSEQVSLNRLVSDDDIIEIKPASKGEDAQLILGRIPECRSELQFNLFGKTVLCPKSVEVNSKVRDMDYEVKAGDKVVVHSSCTVKQLFDFMGIPQEDKVVVNGLECTMDYMLSNGDTIEDYIVKKPKKAKNKFKKDKISNIIADLNESDIPVGPDPLLAPAKPLPSWASDLPIRNSSGMVMNQTSAAVNPAAPPVQMSGRSVTVEINGKKVSLMPKQSHAFVDIFDVYPFDLTKASGKRLISRLNGMDVYDFTTSVHENDSIDLYWEQ